MAQMLPEYLQFDPDDDASTLPARWEDWIDGLEIMLMAMGITDHQRKWALLSHYAGQKCRAIEKHLPYDKTTKFGEEADEHSDQYRSLKEAFTAHFAPLKNVLHASFIFHSMKQDDGETTDAYAARLRQQASRCDFCDKDCMDRNIRDRIVAGCKSSRIRRKALSEDLTLVRLLDAARAEESANACAADIEKAASAAPMEGTDVFRVSKKPGKYSNRVTPQKSSNDYNPPTSTKKCFNCGGPFPHPRDRQCPAKGKECLTCHRKNHFAAVCKNGQRNAFAGAVDQNNSDEETQIFLHAVNIIGSVGSDSHYVNIHTEFGNIKFNPDTGADASLVDPITFDSLRPSPCLHPSRIRLHTYGSDKPLHVLGCFQATLLIGNKQLQETIHVTGQYNRGISLLSRKASKKLGLVTMNLPISQITSAPREGTPDHPMLEEFSDICHGVGCHKDLEISLQLKEGAKPTVAPPSRIPVNLFIKVKQEIDRLTEQGVFEDVPVDDDTQFVSRLVPVPKKIEGTEELGVRLTMDWRELNRNLNPVHHEVPTVEQLKHDLNGAKLFSRIDLKDAFYQLPLDQNSKRLTTFSTPWGLKRCTRLVQGAKPSSSICHEVLRRDLQGIRGALNIADDILLWGCGDTPQEIQEDHDRALRSVFEMFRRKGLTINRKKSIFNATSTKFFGYVFSPEGITADPEKVTALRCASPPKSKEEVRSFLGMAGFNSQFIPNFATISEPLRNLTRKDTKFVWGQREQQSFQALTSAISDVTMLSYYDTRKKTALFTDASPVGVNAILAQLDGTGLYRPVNIASRSLTDTEKKYDQLEREALAMHFGCRRFHMFLAGADFIHFIDPEPLMHMMNNPKKEAPARIEKVRLKLQGFSSDIQLVKGKNNPADYLSRHPLPYKMCPPAERASFIEIQNHLFVVTSMLPEAITTVKIIEEIKKDLVLSRVLQLLCAGLVPPKTDHEL